MALIEWNDDYSVNVKEIDQQHQKLIGMINDLHDAMSEGKGKTVLSDILNRMIQYTKEHFSTEENYFAKWNYPESGQHKNEHEKFVAKVTDFKEGVDSGRLFITVEVLQFLSDWLKNHINKTDKQYSDFFNEHGLY